MSVDAQNRSGHQCCLMPDGKHETWCSYSGKYHWRRTAEFVASLRAQLANKDEVAAQCIKQCEEEQALSTRLVAQLAEKERECERFRAVLANRLKSGNGVPVRRIVLGPDDCEALRRALENDDG